MPCQGAPSNVALAVHCTRRACRHRQRSARSPASSRGRLRTARERTLPARPCRARSCRGRGSGRPTRRSNSATGSERSRSLKIAWHISRTTSEGVRVEAAAGVFICALLVRGANADHRASRPRCKQKPRLGRCVDQTVAGVPLVARRRRTCARKHGRTQFRRLAPVQPNRRCPYQTIREGPFRVILSGGRHAAAAEPTDRCLSQKPQACDDLMGARRREVHWVRRVGWP
jgi:hypothetical protein